MQLSNLNFKKGDKFFWSELNCLMIAYEDKFIPVTKDWNCDGDVYTDMVCLFTYSNLDKQYIELENFKDTCYRLTDEEYEVIKLIFICLHKKKMKWNQIFESIEVIDSKSKMNNLKSTEEVMKRVYEFLY